MAFEKKHLLIISFLLAICNPSPASNPAIQDWKDIGSPSGVTLGIYCHPTEENRIYLILDTGHLFRSDDKGANWKRISHPVALATMPWRQYRGGEQAVAIDPRPEHGNIVYFSPGQDGAGLWKSTDYGDTWLKTPGDDKLGASILTVDYNGTVISIAGNRKIYSSADGGDSWLSYSVPFAIKNNWFKPVSYKLDVEISVNNTIWVTDRNDNSGLYYTTNFGETWTHLIQETQIVDLACSPVDSNLIMALEQDGRIFRSGNATGNFSQVGSVQQNNYWSFSTWPPHTGSIGINAAGTVIAIGRYSLARSTNGGLTFTETPESELNYSSHESWPYIDRNTTDQVLKSCDISSSPVDSTFWIFGDGAMRKISTDNGLSWVGGQGITAHGLWSYGNPTFDAADPNVFHVACVDYGHAYTTDLGKTWFSSETERISCQGVTQDPNNYNIFYKIGKKNNSTQLGFYKSTNRGHNFTKLTTISLSNSDYGGRVFVDPTDSQIIYCTIRGGKGVYRSTNGGASFSNIYTRQNIHHSAVTKSGNVFFHIWNGYGLHRYLKADDKWKDITSWKTVDGFAVHPENENIIFFNAEGILYKTTNGLSDSPTWEEQGNYAGRQIYIDPYVPEYMLMMTEQKNVGMMISRDGGKEWEAFSENLGTSFVWGFVPGGPAAKGRVYAFDAVAYYIDGIYDSSLVSVSENNKDNLLPSGIELGPVYPNPFNSGVQVPFSIYSSGRVNLDIFDLLGKKVRTLVNETKPAGKHIVFWNGRDDREDLVNSGVYLMHLRVGNTNLSHKVIHLK